MAGLFEDQDVGGISGGVQPQQAVAPAPSMLQSVAGSGVINSLGSLAQGIIGGFEAGKQQAAKNTQNAVISGYAKKVTSLNAAVQQGTKTQAAAQREQRALYNQYISNYPQLTEDLTKFNSSIMGSEGLGDTLAKGSAVDQQMQADTKSATAAGFINPGMTPEQQEDGLNAFRAQQHQINQMDFYSKQLGITQQKLSIQASQESIAASRVNRANAAVDLQLKRQKMRVQQATADVATSYFDKTRVQLDQLNQDVASGKIPQEQALQQLQKMQTDFAGLTMPIRGVAGADYVDAMSKPINDIINAQKDFISGKISKDVMQNKLDIANVQSNLEIMSDPQMARVVTASKLTGATFSTALYAQFGSKFVDLVKRGVTQAASAGNMTSDDPIEQAQTKTYLNSVREATKNLGNKDPRVVDPKETFEEVTQHANQLLQGVSDFSSAQKQPSQLNAAMDYLASPEFLALQRMGAKFDQDAVEGAKNAVSVNYNDKLIPVVRDEWEKSKTTVSVNPQASLMAGFSSTSSLKGTNPSAEVSSTPTAIQYSWMGSSIQFKPAPGFEKSPTVLAKVKELQKSVSPLINKTVRANAHMDGSQDYAKYFQAIEPAMFGGDMSPVGEVPNAD